MISSFEKCMLVANMVMAIAAICTLAFAIYQNAESAAVMNSAKDAFAAQAYPLVRFAGYGWGVSDSIDPSPPDCQHPRASPPRSDRELLSCSTNCHQDRCVVSNGELSCTRRS